MRAEVAAVDTLRLEVAAHVLAVPVVTDRRHDRARDAEPCEPGCHVPGEAADEAPEGLDLRERGLELLGIQVGAEPSHDRHLGCARAVRHRWLSYPSRHCNVPEGDRGGSRGDASARRARRCRPRRAGGARALPVGRAGAVRAGRARGRLGRRPRCGGRPLRHRASCTRPWTGSLGLGLDAVVVAVPDAYHADVSIQALEAGLHVLCEKPLALSIAECDRIAAARDAADRVVQVGTMKRFDPAYLRLLELLPACAARRAVRLRRGARSRSGAVRRPLPDDRGPRPRSRARERSCEPARTRPSGRPSGGEPPARRRARLRGATSRRWCTT